MYDRTRLALTQALTCSVTLAALAAALAGTARAQEDPAATRDIPPFVVPEPKPGVTYQRFIAFGDQGTGHPDQHRVARAMALRAASDHVNFLITTGDNFYGFGVRSVLDPQWRTKWEDVYKAESLQIPCYVSLGNHDHAGSIQAQLDYAKTNARWTLPARYYTFTKPLDGGHEVQFFVLDTDVLGVADPGQAEWLAGALEASRARWKIVIGHHPLYSHSMRFYNLRMIRHLEPLLVAHGVDLYVAGHDHILELTKPVKGVNYVVTGAAGGPSKAYPARWTERSHYVATGGGFVLGRISSDQLVLEFVRLSGETQYAHVLTKGRTEPF